MNVTRHKRRRTVRLAAIVTMLLGILPLAGTVSAAHTDRGPVEVAFSVTTTEMLDEGESWTVGDNFYLRGSMTAESVEGDITGTAIITMDGQFIAAEGCNDEACPGNTDVWADFDVTTESGSWDGFMAFQFDDVAATEVGKVFLIGRGDNAGKAFAGDLAFSEEIESSVNVTGQMITMAKPSQGVKVFYDGCFVPPAGTAGAMLMTVGGHDDSGAWSATYPLLIPGAMSFGESTITTELGTVDSFLMIESNGATRNGYFMLTGGTGAYEHLYGFGIVRTSAYESAHCADGAGGYWIGQAYAN
ncbi:hypothetical protein BH23CHL1_BH23CHL1_15710 [soil metagenome]